MTKRGSSIISVIATAILVATWCGMRAAEPTLAPPGGAAGVVRFDFETGELEGWRVVEGKFDFLVCDKKTFRNRPAEKITPANA